MIQLKIRNLDALERELKNKVNGISAIASQQVMTEFSDAAYKISKRQFIRDLNRMAARNQKQFHHIYEWNMVGNNRGRLADITGTITSKGIKISTVLKESKTFVPVDNVLAKPGKTGKRVQQRSVFRNKAELMERGGYVNIVTRRTLAFKSRTGEITFLPKGSVRVKMPAANRGQFERFARTWFSANFAGVIERSRVIKDMELAAAKALNVTGAGESAVKSSVIAAIRKFGVGTNE